MGEITAALRLQFSPVSLKSHLRAPLAVCHSGSLSTPFGLLAIAAFTPSLIGLLEKNGIQPVNIHSEKLVLGSQMQVIPCNRIIIVSQ